MTSGQGVGLVVVSHSRALARAALALAVEMLHGRPVRIELAAGLDETTEISELEVLGRRLAGDRRRRRRRARWPSARTRRGPRAP